MAVSQVVETKTVVVFEETAADSITFNRTPISNAEGTALDIVFGTAVDYSTIQYHSNSTDTNERSDIVKRGVSRTMHISSEKTSDFLATSVTLQDGTVTTLGTLLATFADENIVVQP